MMLPTVPRAEPGFDESGSDYSPNPEKPDVYPLVPLLVSSTPLPDWEWRLALQPPAPPAPPPLPGICIARDHARQSANPPVLVNKGLLVGWCEVVGQGIWKMLESLRNPTG